MNVLVNVLNIAVFISAIMIITIVLFSTSSDATMLSGQATKQMPGTVDAAKNKVLAILATIFVVGILTNGAISTRQRSEAVSLSAIEKKIDLKD